jgi:hypothetical protein
MHLPSLHAVSRRVVLALLCLLVAASCGARGPEATVTRFHELVAEGEVEEALGLLSSDSFSTVSREKIRAGLRQMTLQIDEKGGLADFEITESKELGEVAKVSYKATFGNGDDDDGEVTLVQEDGAWKIQLMSSK